VFHPQPHMVLNMCCISRTCIPFLYGFILCIPLSGYVFLFFVVCAKIRHRVHSPIWIWVLSFTEAWVKSMICFAVTLFNVSLLLFVTAWGPQKILGVLKLMVVWKLVCYTKRIQISHLKIVGTRRVIWSKLHTEDQQMFGATVQTSVARVTWCPGFLQPCMILWFLLNFEVAKTNAYEKYTLCM
jgi:hypothetical protein